MALPGEDGNTIWWEGEEDRGRGRACSIGDMRVFCACLNEGCLYVCVFMCGGGGGGGGGFHITD